MDAPTPGATLRHAIAAAGLTQGGLALKLKLKSTSAICAMCCDQRRITPKMARRIALATGCEAATLIQAQALWDSREALTSVPAC